ncbi:MAG: winged helix-turn-helix transcriptional regulator [Acholeplasmataceae bacterium]|nr:winged helix-turn-helix transcriptional regulator [Acholeplasmataceae bacterium]
MKNIDKCDCKIIHEEIVQGLKEKLAADRVLGDLSEFFKTIGDPTRIKILWALNQKELCVCDVAALLQMKQSAISHQLRILRQAGLVKNRKEGKVVYYSLQDEHVQAIFNLGMEHNAELRSEKDGSKH